MLADLSLSNHHPTVGDSSDSRMIQPPAFMSQSSLPLTSRIWGQRLCWSRLDPVRGAEVVPRYFLNHQTAFFHYALHIPVPPTTPPFSMFRCQRIQDIVEPFVMRSSVLQQNDFPTILLADPPQIPKKVYWGAMGAQSHGLDNCVIFFPCRWQFDGLRGILNYKTDIFILWMLFYVPRIC